MINITQGGLCTGSSMSNYGPTVSDWEQTWCQEELHRHVTQMWVLGEVIVTQISWSLTQKWLSNSRLEVWHVQLEKPWNADLVASTTRKCICCFFSYFQGYTRPQTHNNVHDLTDDNYSMSTFAVQFRALADSSLLTFFFQEFQGLCVLPRLSVHHISQRRHSRGCSPGQP